MTEWKSVPGYPAYEVSDDGKVRRIGGAELNPYLSKEGHRLTSLHADGNRRTYNVGSIVLMAFVGPRPEGMMCRHLDGDGQNNRLSNLRWGTSRENRLDAIQHGTANCVRLGEGSPRAKINNQQFLQIRELLSSGAKQRDVAAMFGVCQKVVTDINTGKRWRHV